MLESMKAVAAIEVPPRYTPRSARDEALRFARTCYDHLAGRLGVAIADALVSRGYVVLTADGGEVTDTGSKFLREFGVDLISSSKRIFCRPCLDWSERRYHIAGLVGAQMWRRCEELNWVVRARDTRAVRVTSVGRTGLREAFGLDLAQLEQAQPSQPQGRLTLHGANVPSFDNVMGRWARNGQTAKGSF
jgi:hypothetical protein